MKTEDALYHAVHDYPEGVNVLADRMDISPSTLQSMANPSLQSHGWNLRRLRQVIHLTGDARPIQALANECGGVFVPMKSLTPEKLPEIFRDLAALTAELGEVAKDVQESMTDGRITPNEAKRISTHCMQLIEGCADLMKTADEMSRRAPSLRSVG